MTASPSTAAPAARWAVGEDATILATAKADPGYLAPVATATGFRLPGGRVIVASPDWRGVTLVHGDIRDTLIQALKDAMEYRDCAGRDPVCEQWHLQYGKALDVLGAGQ